MSGRLQRELKMSKPFAAPEVEAWLSLVRTTDLLSRRMGAVLKPFDLTISQYNVLRILRGAGTAGLPCNEVGSRLVTWDPDITRLLDRLERRGLVLRTRSQKDRRVVLVTITRAGANLLTMMHVDDHVHRAHLQTLGHIGHPELEQLIDLLESIRAKIEDGPPT